MSDFVERARRNSGQSTPRRTIVREHWSCISAALAAGASVGAVYRTLKADRIDVGSLSGFKLNVRVIAAEQIGTGAEDADKTGAASDVTNVFADSRFKSAY